MFGIDLSNHQRGIDLSKKNFDFGIVKATEGLTYKDPSFESHIEQLRKLDKCIGCYHFARPDNQNTIKSMEKSADHFINIIKDVDLIGHAILVIDWEKWPTERTDLLQAWVCRVYDRLDITPFIYANSSFINNNKKFVSELSVPLWVASWPNFSEVKEWPDDYFIDYYNPFSTGWKIWQFTSQGVWPKFRGRVDLNYTPMSPKMWTEYAIGGNRDKIEEITDDMKWAINMGIIKGFSDGLYRPNSTVTRNQLVTILKRYYDFLKNENN